MKKVHNIRPITGDNLKKPEHNILICTQLNDLEGVKASLNEDPGSIYHRDPNFMDALDWAICNNSTAIAEVLLSFRGMESTENLPLDAVSRNYGGICKIDFRRKDGFGREYGQLALMKGNSDMIRLIAKYQFPEAFDEDSDWNKDDLPTHGTQPKPPRKFEP